MEGTKMKKYEYHHTALTRGYVSVKANGIKSAYTGRFGTGYTVKRNNPDSTRYCYVDYYIEK
jgi:hypothetical protein